MTIWNRAKVLTNVVRLMAKPNQTELIFKIVSTVLNDPKQKMTEPIVTLVLSNPKFKIMFEQQYLPQLPSLESLAKCAPGTFGEAYFNHISLNKLKYDFWPSYNLDSPIEYLLTRVYLDHDLWHTLLGLGVSVEDELAINSFAVAQLQTPIGILLVAAGLLHLLNANPARALNSFKKVAAAYTLGSQSPFLLSIRLHELFDEPIENVRRMCGIHQPEFITLKYQEAI